jgi:hypothetical protein
MPVLHRFDSAKSWPRDCADRQITPRRLLGSANHLSERRLGNLLRFAFAISRSSSSLIDRTICLEAPLRLDLGRLPRFADKAAPAAICCFFDFALGIASSKPGVRAKRTQR